MPQVTDRNIYIRRGDGFSLEGGSASAQRNGTNSFQADDSVRTFDDDPAVVFGPLEPGAWEATLFHNATPGLAGIANFAFKVGDATMNLALADPLSTAPEHNVDHMPALKYALVATSAGGSAGILYCAFEFVIESQKENFIAFVAGPAGPATRVSLQKLG